MNVWITAFLLGIGAAFMFLAALGVMRMPDLFTRMQAATKAATLGTASLLLAVAWHFGHLGVTTRVGLIIGFIVLTAPVAAHMIGRAAYFVGVPLWQGTVCDELRDQYDQQTHRLDSRATDPLTSDSPHDSSP